MSRKTGSRVLDQLFLKTEADREDYARACEELAISEQVFALRKQAGLTQKRLAKMVGTSHSVISRLENADYEGHSLSMLRRIADALGYEVELRFVPRQDRS